MYLQGPQTWYKFVCINRKKNAMMIVILVTFESGL